MNFFFANPAWWLAALAAVPLLAHLFSRSRPRVRMFPSIQLLRQAMLRVTRIRKPRDRWLLLVRTLAMAMLALAFLQPWLLSHFASGAGTAKSVVILVDVSASMGYADGTRTRVAQAAARAEDVLASLPSGSTANIIWIRAQAKSELPEPGFNLDYLRQSLRQAVAVPERGDIGGAVALGLKQLTAAEGARELVVLSDFQKSEWRDIKLDAPAGVRVTRLPLGTEEAANMGLGPIVVEPAQPVAGQEARLVCRLRNFSAEPHRATIFVEAGEGRLSQTVEVAPWSETPAVLPVKFPQEGTVPLKATLTEDRFPVDDVAYGIAEVRGPLQVGVTGSPEDATARVWLRASQSLDGVVARHIERVESPGRLDVLMVPAWDGQNADKLSALLRQGVGIVIQPRPGVAWNSARTLLGQPPVQGGAPLSGQAKDAPGWRLRIAAETHAIFAMFATGAYDDPCNTTFTRRVAMPAELPGTMLLAYEDGAAGLALLSSQERRLNHRVAWWNMDLSATDWPNHSAFIAFFGEFLRHFGAAGSAGSIRMHDSGNTVSMESIGEVDPAGVALLNEKDENIPLVKSTGYIAMQPVAKPGSYRWMNGPMVLDRFAVTYPESESDLRRLSMEELQKGGGEVMDATAQGRLGELREGRPLWPWFVVAAAILFLMEGILLRMFPVTREDVPVTKASLEKKEGVPV